jgi:hypothetical protein
MCTEHYRRPIDYRPIESERTPSRERPCWDAAHNMVRDAGAQMPPSMRIRTIVAPWRSLRLFLSLKVHQPQLVGMVGVMATPLLAMPPRVMGT